MKRNNGFTMIEILIVVVVAAIVVAGLMYVLSGSRRATRIADIDSQAQQNARVAIDFVTKDLRSAGYGLDFGNGQVAIAYAGPYDVVINANIEPVPDRGSTPGYPAAIDISASPATVPPSGTALYTPARTYETGAETVRFTLDSNNDGVINQNDSTDEPVEGTPNPYDYSLLRQIYGFDGASNGGVNEPVALIRGPGPYTDGTYPHPLFTYWYDHDDDVSTPDLLWGDGSGNGELEQGEIVAIGPVTGANRTRINRIGITATGISRSQDSRHTVSDGYREAVITSEVNVRRSRPGTAAYIRGVVFDDINGDGVQGSGEPGISDVGVRLNTGVRTRTAAAGFYAFRVDPGPYTVTETDPIGYTSTTPNAVLVNAVKGGVAIANFGDRAIAGYGGILGMVVLWEQEGANPPEPTEYGVGGVEIFLNTGERDTTSNIGQYSFMIPASSYTITMDVPSGYQAIGHTSVTRAVAEGDTVMVDFGLLPVEETGTIAGKVFEDANGDGVLDLGESGIENVVIRLSSGDSTRTDATGDYSFTVLPGTYDVTEEDLAGYISTTVNNVTGVIVEVDSTVIVNFGDTPATEMSFTVITLGETQRALCITSADLQEFKDPGNTDQEIILGTKYVSGISNLNIWKNNWETMSTPNSAIFDQDPWYSRTPSEDILSVDKGDINADGVEDIVTGLTSASGKVLSWVTQTTGNKAGLLPDVPNSFFISTGVAHVLSLKLCHADMDGNMDILLGTEYAPDLGIFEVWFGDGSGNFTHDVASDVYEWTGLQLLNSVRSLAAGNLVGSPAQDVVLGTASGVNTGEMEIFRDNGAPNGKFIYYATIQATGEVNAVILADMKEDSYGDLDIIAGTRTGVGTGYVELWHNNGDGTFGEDLGLGVYAPSDTIGLPGEVLSLGVDYFNRDIYPDVVVGLKRAAAFSGEIRVFEAYGYLPSAENAYISPDIGEAITLTVNDFNEDYLADIAVGTRTSLSQGHVVVFFNETPE
jgi:prepilin-type N-terminal cleavage/methylation domain-containing protein